MRTDLFDFDLPDDCHRAGACEPRATRRACWWSRPASSRCATSSPFAPPARERVEVGAAAHSGGIGARPHPNPLPVRRHGRWGGGREFARPVVRDLPDLLRPGDALVFNDTRVIRAALQGERLRGENRRAHRLQPAQARRRKPLARVRPAGQAPRRRRPHPLRPRRPRLPARHARRHGEPRSAKRARSSSPSACTAPTSTKRSRRWATRRCRPTSRASAPSSLRTPSATRPSTPATTARWPRRPPACISRRRCWRRWTRAASPATSSRCTSAPAPSCPSRPTIPREHRMHAEWGEISAETAAALNARARRRRPHRRRRHHVAAAAGDGGRRGWHASGRSPARPTLFITPGYRFKAVDLLMTNFHLPRSTLFMLVGGLQRPRHHAAPPTRTRIARGLSLLFLRRRLPAPSGAEPHERIASPSPSSRPTAAPGSARSPRRAGKSARRPSCRWARRPPSRPSTPTSSRSCRRRRRARQHLPPDAAPRRRGASPGSAACTASCAGTARSSRTPAASRS